MSLNFNVDPYYDDFDPSKNYHRILFKPGYAVQARELTQTQSILQDQITKFADNIFKQNTPVTGGQVTTNLSNAYYIKLNPTYNGAAIDVTSGTFVGASITNQTTTVIAQVVAVASAVTGGDPDTLVVIYKTGTHFVDGDTIYSISNIPIAQAISTSATGLSSVVSIAQGVFYISSNYKNSNGITVSNGNFVQVNPQTAILSKYSNVPNLRIGLQITETIYDYVNDAALLDPAIGASNYQAPGADRYVITLTLESRPLTLGDDQNFIELVRVTNGQIQKLVDNTVYNVIDDYFAKRDYETNGDYIVNDFLLTPKANTSNSNVYTMSISTGIAYVHGYRIESTTPVDITSNRARTYNTINNDQININYGSFLYANTIVSTNNSGSAVSFDPSTYQSIDIHCVPTANINVTTSSAYTSTVIASGYLRGLINDSAGNNLVSNTYIYKTHISDLQLNSPSANAVSATSNTITLPSYYSASNLAYVGAGISITTGTDAGDFRTITSYNGVSKTATVNQNWTVTPDTTSVFVLNYSIATAQSIANTSVKTSYPLTIYGTAKIDPKSKNGANNIVQIQDPTEPELLFPIGNPYVKSLSGTAYVTQIEWRGVPFQSDAGVGGFSATLDTITYFPTEEVTHYGTASAQQSAATVVSNYTIIVTSKSAGCTLNVGDNVPWTTTGRNVTFSGGATGKRSAKFAATDIGSAGFTATIIAKMSVSNGDATTVRKTKTLITANTSTACTSGTLITGTNTYVDDTQTTSTGQVYIQNAGLVTPGNKQSLYLSDVKNIVKILDSGSPSVTPVAANFSSYTDITNNYTFDNGQRDNYYDHASITLRPGASQPNGNILVFVNYYQHSGGDGYFSINSYSNESYQNLPFYTAKNGTTYALRDCVDFRPSRANHQSDFTFRYASSSLSNTSNIIIPIDNSTFQGNYTYYLARKDKLVLTKDRSFVMIEGTPDKNPIFPSAPDGSLVIANLSHNPYTGYLPTEAPSGVVPDLSITKVKHKRYTMQDIAGLENRINAVEYYTSLSLLEQKASSLQISDAFGLNRFKNGIMVDDFSSYATADTLNYDYLATINRRTRQLTATQQVKNFPLTALAQVYNMGQLSSTASSSLGYSINSDSYINYFTLPISSTANVAKQQFASSTTNVNPFSYTLQEGTLSISPNVDNWVDTNYSPALLIVDKDTQIFKANAAAMTVMSAGDWQAISSTTISDTTNTVGHGINPSPYGYLGYSTTTTTTITTQTQNNILGAYDKLSNTYGINNGYITDISILPYIRAQQIVVRAKNMLFSTPVVSYFDNASVNNYIRKSNIIELTGVTGTFVEDDVVGYYVSPTFTPTGRVVGVYLYPGTNGRQVRLYVAADPTTTNYAPSGTFQTGYFDVNGNYSSTTATGTIASTQHNGGRIYYANTATTIQLSPLASTTNGWYTGNTIYICSGTGVGQSAVISNYVGANQTAILATSITASNNDIYSIGSFSTNEEGSFYGIFNLPAGIFHTGQRVLRIDNSTGGNQSSATTYSQSTYYAQGLQTQAQQIDFAASPAGAKNTFTQVNQQQLISVQKVTIPWDPVAQTFIIDGKNYPNGIFLNDIKVFFRTKPTDNSPVTLSIVGTTNGYPNGSTLDHSIVTLKSSEVNASTSYTENPHYLDSRTYTTFNFSVPVYIQPDTLYAFIVKSGSNAYTIWTGVNGENAVASSVKNLPTDPSPSTITKLGGSPYVGSLFMSQNSQTWTADQNKSLMFVINQCIFNTSSPTIQFVIPGKLPQRTLVEQSVDYYKNPNTILATQDLISTSNVIVDAFNVTTTDFVPTTTNINYSYNATLSSGSAAGVQNITPGKYGTSSYENLYLNDNQGERVLVANSNTSFSVYASLSTADSYVSPIISDAGLTAYAITWNINNCPLSNSLITITNGGSSYANGISGSASGTANVTISAPTGVNGVQAYAVANVSNNSVTSVWITTPGSGYITTPTITISSGTGSGANVTIAGETSPFGGPAIAKYVTKKVVLDAGFDSGDLNVYLSAYRPINTDINVYYKILNRNDAQTFESGNWQLMTKINASGTAYSQTRNDLYEYVFAPGAYSNTSGVDQGYVSYTSTVNGQTYNTFSQFAIKVVLTTTDNTFVPFVSDLRAIALPPNVNTTF